VLQYEQMPRQPDGLEAKTVTGSYRFTPATAKKFDLLRGKTPKSTYLEKLILQEAKRQKEDRHE
jgi:hypothetical protein